MDPGRHKIRIFHSVGKTMKFGQITLDQPVKPPQYGRFIQLKLADFVPMVFFILRDPLGIIMLMQSLLAAPVIKSEIQRSEIFMAVLLHVMKFCGLRCGNGSSAGCIGVVHIRLFFVSDP